jgi:hypothetical protein
MIQNFIHPKLKMLERLGIIASNECNSLYKLFISIIGLLVYLHFNF